MIKIKYNNQENFEEVSFRPGYKWHQLQTRVSFAAWRPDKKTQLGDFAEMSEKASRINEIDRELSSIN